jgi:hypothetical protein
MLCYNCFSCSLVTNLVSRMMVYHQKAAPTLTLQSVNRWLFQICFDKQQDGIGSILNKKHRRSGHVFASIEYLYSDAIVEAVSHSIHVTA